MKRHVIRICVLAAVAVAGLAVSGSAQAAPRAAACAVPQVTLNGSAAPQVRCLSHSRAGVSPSVVESGSPCPSDDLILYWNGPYNYVPNTLLCLYGVGTLNLNQNFYGLNWNDETSAYWTGCDNVEFWKDINASGAEASAAGSPYGQYTSPGIFPLGGIGNDQLSSVTLLAGGTC